MKNPDTLRPLPPISKAMEKSLKLLPQSLCTYDDENPPKCEQHAPNARPESLGSCILIALSVALPAISLSAFQDLHRDLPSSLTSISYCVDGTILPHISSASSATRASVSWHHSSISLVPPLNLIFTANSLMTPCAHMTILLSPFSEVRHGKAWHCMAGGHCNTEQRLRSGVASNGR
jgi:hypothetical protein